MPKCTFITFSRSLRDEREAEEARTLPWRVGVTTWDDAPLRHSVGLCRRTRRVRAVRIVVEDAGDRVELRREDPVGTRSVDRY